MGVNFYLEQYLQHKINQRNQSRDFMVFLENLRSLDCVDDEFELVLKPRDTQSDGIILQPKKPLSADKKERILSIAKSIKPWRKGPFFIDDLHIDSEWRSYVKFNLLAPHLNLEGKSVLDMGCNNGYYLFEMLRFAPKELFGFDPSAVSKAQFDFINHFAKTPIVFYRLGIEELRDFCEAHNKQFDVIFCLGVLYHRSDPIASLKHLSVGLKKGGELFLDCLMFQNEQEVCLCPKQSYAKMRNVYFIPSISALQGWCERAGFGEFEILALNPTTTQEQRKSDWIDSLSLESFLDTNGKTIEGYDPPLRGYFKLKKL